MEAFDRTRTPWVRNASGAIEADHYTPVFCVMNLRDAVVREYSIRRWKEAADVGLGAIFLDSSFNLSSDKFHWEQNADAGRGGGATADQTDLLGHFRPAAEPSQAILSQYRAHLDLMKEMQDVGYEYCNEDLGVFGIHRHGPSIDMRLPCLFLWQECLANFDVPVIRKAGADPEDVFFRGLAYRMMWLLYWVIDRDVLSFCISGHRGDFDAPSPRQVALLKTYATLNDAMSGPREILPREAGVLYRNGGRRVLWAFRNLRVPLKGATVVRDVLEGTETRSPWEPEGQEAPRLHDRGRGQRLAAR